MVMKVTETTSVPNVVVIDPCFDAYSELVQIARSGRIRLHMRSSGAEGLTLAKKSPVDAWLVAADLDDMSGIDFVELLRHQLEAGEVTNTDGGEQRVAMVHEPQDKTLHWQAIKHGSDTTMVQPISMSDLESFLDMTPVEREMILPNRDITRSILTLPVSIGAAVVSLAVVMLG